MGACARQKKATTFIHQEGLCSNSQPKRKPVLGETAAAAAAARRRMAPTEEFRVCARDRLRGGLYLNVKPVPHTVGTHLQSPNWRPPPPPDAGWAGLSAVSYPFCFPPSPRASCSPD